MRQGRRPTVTEYDLTKRIPDESCSISPQASQRSCSEEAYDVVLYHELISEAGKYYIGILYEGGSVRPQGRKKRSCFGSGRQKRSCVEVKDPPRPENKTIKPVYNSRTDMNYSMNILEESCVFWDSREEHWLSTGCRVRVLKKIHLQTFFFPLIRQSFFHLVDVWKSLRKFRYLITFRRRS